MLIKTPGSGGAPGTSGSSALNQSSAASPEQASHGHTAFPQPSNDMNVTLDQASLQRKVVTVFVSSAVLNHVNKIIDSLSQERPLHKVEHEYYSELFDMLREKNLFRNQLREIFPKKIREGIAEDECLCLGVFSAEKNDLERGWSKEKINTLFSSIPTEEDRGHARYRLSDHRTPVYQEVNEEFYSFLPHENDDQQLVMPKNDLRILTIDADNPEPFSIIVPEKKELKKSV